MSVLVLGVVTASTVVDGRRPVTDAMSIWDVYSAAPGRVTDGTTPSDGPRHRQHWRDDVRLLADLGVGCYRFSLPWALLADPRAVEWDHYRRLAESLLAAGIAPLVTLTHYDMPLPVMEGGGWLVRETADRFAEFAAIAAGRLADLVPRWITMNAPLVHAAYGYGLGIEAPGLTLLAGALVAGRHQLLGHGAAVEALRAGGVAEIGIANVHAPVRPLSADPADTAAAALLDALLNRAFTDPLVGLEWPDELSALPGAPDDSWSTSERQRIASPLDFYGVNYYHPHRVAAAPDNASIPFTLVDPAPDDRTDPFGWPIDPAGLTETLLALQARRPELPPLWVTENGTQDAGGTDDRDRAEFLVQHVAAVDAAVAAGADVRGYLHWSLLDGWEFAEGLTRHFGLVAVDPVTAERRPKASYAAYRDLIATAKPTSVGKCPIVGTFRPRIAVSA